MSDLSALQPLLGLWTTSGQVMGDAGEVVGQISGTDRYELLDGVGWIAHTADVEMPDGRVRVFELIGGAHPDGGWGMHAFDDAGDAPGLMRLTAEGDGQLLMQGDGLRSWLSPNAGVDHMEARWERLVDGDWTLWMTMRFDRA